MDKVSDNLTFTNEFHRQITKTREPYFEVIRIIAAFMVIFQHSEERGFDRYLVQAPGSLSCIYNMIFPIISKTAVPLYFMVSGALLLKRDESIKKTYSRIPRIAIDLVLFSIAYVWGVHYISGTPITILDTVSILLHACYWHLWFLYAYIAFLLTLPLLRAFVRSMEKEHFILLYILAVVVAFCYPVVLYFVDYLEGRLLPTWVAEQIIIYPILGYAIDSKIDIRKVGKKAMIAMWTVFLVTFVAVEMIQIDYLKKVTGPIELLYTCHVIIATPIIFITVKKIMSSVKLSDKACKILAEIGACTFGIYLFHLWFFHKDPLLYRLYMFIENFGFFGCHFGVYVSILIDMIVCGVITFILRRIPVIKKLF